jgi:hypothetical protein
MKFNKNVESSNKTKKFRLNNFDLNELGGVVDHTNTPSAVNLLKSRSKVNLNIKKDSYSNKAEELLLGLKSTKIMKKTAPFSSNGGNCDKNKKLVSFKTIGITLSSLFKPSVRLLIFTIFFVLVLMKKDI